MRFALNQMGFPEEGLLENARLLADAGYDGIEPNLTDDGPLWDDEFVEELADELERLGLDVPAISTTLHWERRLSAADDETRAAGIDAGERMLEVAEHYHHFGGKSPINEQNRALVAAIEREFAAHGPPLPVYWGNRNWHPFLTETLRKMADDGVRRALAFVTSAFSSSASGSSSSG